MNALHLFIVNIKLRFQIRPGMVENYWLMAEDIKTKEICIVQYLSM